MNSTEAIKLVREMMNIFRTSDMAEKRQVMLMLVTLRQHKLLDGPELVQALEVVVDFYQRHVRREVKDAITDHKEPLDPQGPGGSDEPEPTPGFDYPDAIEEGDK